MKQQIYPTSGYDVDSVINDIRESIELERLAESASTWTDLFFPGPALRGMLVVGAGTAVAQQIVGIDAIQYFLLFIIDKTGIADPEVQRVVLIGLGIIKLGFIFVSARFVDTQGRRSLFFISLVGTYNIPEMSVLSIKSLEKVLLYSIGCVVTCLARYFTNY